MNTKHILASAAAAAVLSFAAPAYSQILGGNATGGLGGTLSGGLGGVTGSGQGGLSGSLPGTLPGPAAFSSSSLTPPSPCG